MLLFNKIDLLINEAQLCLNDSRSYLSKALEIATETDDEGSSDEDKVLNIQLTLQYRLSCEDALSILLKFDHNLLFALGVQPEQSIKVNKDRLAYAVGNEDLKQLLTILANLTTLLSKIVSRHKYNNSGFKFKSKQSQKSHSIARELSTLLVKQNKFLEVLQQLDPEISQLLKLQAGTAIFDYISALRGPISDFYQAMLHGLELGKQLYLELNKTPLIEYQLNTLIKEAHEILHLMPSIYNSPSHYPIKQFDQTDTSEQLEQRAAAKRLRPFFG